MELDARELPEPHGLETDVCIVGAGPAGLTIAERLCGLGVMGMVLESGGRTIEQPVQALNEGVVHGDADYAGLHATRQRGVGGTSLLWNTPVRGEAGAKYAPLDVPDFEARPAVPLSGWPFERARLEPFYRRALEACGLGGFAWEAGDWADAHGPAPIAGTAVRPRVYQFGTARALIARKLSRIREADNIQLLHHATAAVLELDAPARRIVGVRGVDGRGRAFRVRTRIVVLAAGAIENARLLLLAEGGVPGNRHDWVGRCFMEHPRDYGLTLRPRSAQTYRELAFFDAWETNRGVVGGRLALADEVVRAGALNASATLLPRLRNAAPSRTGARRILDRLRRLARRRGPEGYGWSRVAEPDAVFDGFRLILNVEQHPHRTNRIGIGTVKDPLGLPRAELHWCWSGADQDALDRVRTLVVDYLEGTGLGQVEVRRELRPDPNAHHHAGTTRMHRDARLGVVDADARVHGTDNVYVCGASVFPTAGYANPTLTIVALALRLADHLVEIM